MAVTFDQRSFQLLRVVDQMSVLATGSVMLLQCGKGKPP